MDIGLCTELVSDCWWLHCILFVAEPHFLPFVSSKNHSAVNGIPSPRHP
uniref:BTB domain-containing protein n=1 Tax=Parascaris univalens TaxID=6257 RepID=A0A915B776_PARUN